MRRPVGAQAALAAILLIAFSGANARPPEEAIRSGSGVQILLSSRHPAYLAAEEGARATLEAAFPDLKVETVTLADDERGVESLERAVSAGALVVAIGSRAARAVRAVSSEIRLVYAMVLDPAAAGLPAPGEVHSSKTTGISLDVDIQDQLSLIRSVLPSARRIGVLYDPAFSEEAVARARAAAGVAGFKLVAHAVRTDAAVLEAAALLAPAVDAVLTLADPTVLTDATTRPLILLWLRARKPLFAHSEGFVRNGALAALVPDPGEAGRRAGEMAAQIRRGSPSATLLAERPPRLSVFLNKASADHLGISLPASVLSRAAKIFPEE